MMARATLIALFLLLLIPAYSFAIPTGEGQPIATDSRIKTFVYSENEVFPIVLHYGYQTSIEFAKGETIQTYSVGNTYSWQISPIGRTMFIKPLEDDILTNMTIITNKRRYYFELQSKMNSEAVDEQLAYVVRFFYPDEHQDKIKPVSSVPRIPSATINKPSIPVITPYNFDYSYSGSPQILPTNVFDDGTRTFFQYANGIKFIPTLVSGGNELPIQRIGNYIVVNQLSSKFTLSYSDYKVIVQTK